MVAHSGLLAPELISTDRIVKAVDNTLHQPYSFYIKVSAWGGSTAYFGPYTLNVGCFDGTVYIMDDGLFLTSMQVYVGNSATSVYTYKPPYSDVEYCIILSNEVVGLDEGPWVGTPQMIPTGSPPYTIYSID